MFRRLDIAMDDALAVSVVDGVANLAGRVQVDPPMAKITLIAKLIDRRATNQLHHKVR